MPPIPDRFVAHIDTPFVQQVFHISERKGEANLQHHRQADNLGTRLEIAKGGPFTHAGKLDNRPTRFNRIFI